MSLSIRGNFQLFTGLFSGQTKSTLLHKAVTNKDKKLINFFIRKGANLEEKNKDGDTLLLRAISQENKELATLLISNGADVNALNKHGNTPLQLAMFSYYSEEVVKLLISNGADMNLPDKNGNTPLLRAILRENERLAKLLILNGADVNVPDKDGNTPLLRTIRTISEISKKINIPNMLKGQSVNTETETVSKLKKKEAFVALLISNGANLEIQDRDGNTPLQRAISYRLEEVAKLLISKGANLEIQDRDGNTLLQRVISYRLEEVAKLLISKGANLEVQDKDGNTPLKLAINRNLQNLAKYFISRVTSKNSEAIKPDFIKNKIEFSAYWDKTLKKGSDKQKPSREDIVVEVKPPLFGFLGSISNFWHTNIGTQSKEQITNNQAPAVTENNLRKC